MRGRPSPVDRIVQPLSPSPTADPPRPDVASGAVRAERRWWPAVAVAALIVGVVLGGYLTADALTSGEGPPRTVGGIVTIRPAAGWEASDDPGGEGSTRITRGSATLDVFTGAVTVDARAVARAYVDGSLEPDANRLTVAPEASWEPVSLGGLAGIRLGYIGVFDQSGVPIEGEVTAVVTSAGDAVVFDGWAPQGQLGFAVDDVHRMEEGAAFP